MSHAIEFIETTFSPNRYKTLPQRKNLGRYKTNSSHGLIKTTSSKELVGYAKLEWQWVIKEKVAVQGLFIF